MKKLSKQLISFILLLPLSSTLYCHASSDPLSRMDNTLGKAYKAASENKSKTALKLFREAEDLAREAKSWRGLLEAGNAYRFLWSPKEALPLLRQAGRTAYKEKDWRGLIASAYSMKELSGIPNSKKYSRDLLLKAAETAESSHSWRGLLMAAKGFLETGYSDIAIETADKAAIAADISADPAACRQVAKFYQRMGLRTRSIKMIKLRKKYLGARKAIIEKSGNDPQNRDMTGTIDELKKTLAKESREKKYYRKYWIFLGKPFDSPDIRQYGNYYLRYYDLNNGVYIFKGI